MHDGTDDGTGSHAKGVKISEYLALAACVCRSCSDHITLLINCDLGKAYKDIHVSKEAIANARNETIWNKAWDE